MFFKEENIEERAEEIKKRGQELTEQLASLFDEFEITPEEMEAYLSNPDNFTEEQRELMEKQQKDLEEKLKQDLDNLPDPNRTKKTYKKLRQKSNWIPI